MTDLLFLLASSTKLEYGLIGCKAKDGITFGNQAEDGEKIKKYVMLG